MSVHPIDSSFGGCKEPRRCRVVGGVDWRSDWRSGPRGSWEPSYGRLSSRPVWCRHALRWHCTCYSNNPPNTGNTGGEWKGAGLFWLVYLKVWLVFRPRVFLLALRMQRYQSDVIGCRYWCVYTELKPLDLFICGHYWRKLPSQGSLCALTCEGQTKTQFWEHLFQI